MLEHDEALYALALPEPATALPRAMPLPKAKALSKWDKFRLEKGISPRKKRSRLVFDPATKDWAPRWGYKSAKKN